MPAPYNHRSGLSGVYDRSPDFPDFARVLFREGKIAQAAEVMEAQSIIENRGTRIASQIMRDGDRIESAAIIIDADAETATMTAGKVYARGDVRSVSAAVLESVPMTGEVSVGVRIITTVVTESEEPALLGLHPGSEGEGEAGAGREIETAVWGFDGDGEDGDLFQVYLLKDGVAVDQTPPPSLSGVNQAIAIYDRDANGSYVVRGCRVRALGVSGGAQHFSIGEGTANILGFKRVREFSLRHIEDEEPDLATVDAEPHTFEDGGSGTAVIALNKGPIAALNQAIITKQKTITLVKGVSGSADPLPDDSVASIVSVVQGATTYVSGTDYILTADAVDWSPGGSEPSSGSSYDVTYQYLDAVTPDELTSDKVTLSGGVTGATVLLSYDWKLPRYDLICLDQSGFPVYIKGISSAAAPKAPPQPTTLLKLAEIQNDWRGAATVVNTDVRSVPYEEMWTYFRRFFDLLDLVALERLKSDIDTREPVAKKGVFVDPWTDDTYRDAGEPQTAAIFDGAMRLAIEPTIYLLDPDQPVMLDYTHEVIVRQELATGCMKINPYQNFDLLPGQLSLDPPSDFWTETQTIWASDVTRAFFGSVASTTTEIDLVDERNEAIPFLREIDVDFVVKGFGGGENLESVTFDGLDVTPIGAITANSSGELSGTFTIPENIPSGTKTVVVAGEGGSTASATWAGAGVLNIETLRRVTTITQVQWSGFSGAGGDGWGIGGGGGGGNGKDPLAQTFTLIEDRHVSGFDFRVCAVGNEGNSITVEIRTVENGVPTLTVLAQAIVSMEGVSPGQWIEARFNAPVFLTADRSWAVVIKSDDAEHALSIARLGDFDATIQRFVSAQPYSIGVLLSSSNAETWTPHQAEDLTFRVVAAKFSPTTKTVALGSIGVSGMSDMLIRAGVETPNSQTGLIFEVERADGTITRVQPGQVWSLDEYVSENITVRAVLTGTEKASPTLFPRPILITGELASSATYITRAFSMGSAIRMSAFLKSQLPAGSTLTVEIDAADDDWDTVAQHASTVLDGGWIEREFRVDPYTADQGRLRITLTGTPAARPVLSDMRAVSI